MKKHGTIIIAALCMLTMILLGANIADGAREGVTLCLQVVIPALFPFFVISTYLNGQLSGLKFRALRPIEPLCGMPNNSGPIFLLGLLGGYPVGAQSIAQWHENKTLPTRDAERLLGFCNNPGPAFIFGMLSAFFPSQKYLWTLWFIQIISALLTGIVLPGRQKSTCKQSAVVTITLPQALERSVRSILLVCGWVILFRIILSFFSAFPNQIQIILCGITELTNGCMQLNNIRSLEIRFVAASAFLSFGGLCVHMQTLSAAKGLRLSHYFIGKVIQTIISVVLSVIIMKLICSEKVPLDANEIWILLLSLIAIGIGIIFFRKNSSISKANVIQ